MGSRGLSRLLRGCRAIRARTGTLKRSRSWSSRRRRGSSAWKRKAAPMPTIRPANRPATSDSFVLGDDAAPGRVAGAALTRVGSFSFWSCRSSST